MKLNEKYKKEASAKLIANRENRDRKIADESIKYHTKAGRFGMKLEETPSTSSESFIEEFGIKNKMAIPKLIKVIVNMGVGDSLKDKSLLESLKKDLAAITGQIPQIRSAKVSVASFGIRKGMPVGLKVTLRGNRMYAFLQRFIGYVLPRLRDFKGVPLKSFDKRGNYTLGVIEHTVFPEIDLVSSKPHGLEITIVTNAADTEKSRRLLELLGMPFAKDGSG